MAPIRLELIRFYPTDSESVMSTYSIMEPMEIRAGFEPAHHSVADCCLSQFSYRTYNLPVIHKSPDAFAELNCASTSLRLCIAPARRGSNHCYGTGISDGADDGDRTRMTTLARWRSTIELRLHMEPETGVEPVSSAWKAEVLPLNYSGIGRGCRNRTHIAGFGDQSTAIVPNPYYVNEAGLEPACVILCCQSSPDGVDRKASFYWSRPVRSTYC